MNLSLQKAVSELPCSWKNREMSGIFTFSGISGKSHDNLSMRK